MNNEPNHARLQQSEAETIAESPLSPTFSAFGFSPQRVAKILCTVSVCLLPIHYLDFPCEISALAGGFGFLILLLVLGLCFMTPRGTDHRFRAGAWAFFAYVIHALSTH